MNTPHNVTWQKLHPGSGRAPVAVVALRAHVGRRATAAALLLLAALCATVKAALAPKRTGRTTLAPR